MSVQLASYEANSAALMGDTQRAETHSTDPTDRRGTIRDDDSGSPWAFPAQTPSRLPAVSRCCEPVTRRRATCGSRSRPKLGIGRTADSGTWAQVRIGAAIAHLQRGQLDGTAEEIGPSSQCHPT